MLIKLCMYLEQLREETRFNPYFEHFKTYQKVTIKPKEGLFSQLIETACFYLDFPNERHITLNCDKIDYRLLVLLLHYNKLFQRQDSDFQEDHFIWIAKPIASSRGAGISIFRSNS